jgi:hypothetical protein
MTSPINSARRLAALRRVHKADADAPPEAEAPRNAGLPVPVTQARPSPSHGGEAEAALAAHLLGQDGEKRGLRGGPTVIDGAQAAYNKAEWSGAKDRRARQGKHAKTEI